MLDVLDTIDPAAPSLPAPLPLSFRLDAAHEAHEPPEATGRSRDDVRLLVSRGDRLPLHARFTELPDQLTAGDLLVVNTSATVAAALDVVIDGVGAVVLHVSNELPGGVWMVEPRRRIANGSTEPMQLPPLPAHGVAGADGAAIVDLLRPAPESTRLWLAVTADGVDLAETMAADGRPIRYSYVPARLAARRLPDRVRHRTGQRRDAERGAAVHRRDRHPPRQPRRRRRPDRPAHRRVVARRARASLPRALPRAARHCRARERHPPRRAPRRRRRHHRGAGARDRHRSRRHHPPRHGLDRRRRHAPTWRAGGRRPAHRLARARGHPPGDAGGGGGARGARGRLRGGVRGGLPVARVRRQPPPAPRREPSAGE